MQFPLPAGVRVFERGWLSANNILLQGAHGAALVDSGYATHSAQTVSLAAEALGGQPLSLLLNTHLHSDHCGGNAALQERWPDVRTLVPPGQAEHVRTWDPVALTYVTTGQQCPRFTLDGVLTPGERIDLGDRSWEIHAAPGHDPHSVMLFEPMSRVLLSADALWRNGFGIVFPELEGEPGFGEVAATLDLVESLRPEVVVPGHGTVFTEVADALRVARQRLDAMARDPLKHARHAMKALLKFKLLEVQQMELPWLCTWASSTPYFIRVHARFFSGTPINTWAEELAGDLVRSGAAAMHDGVLLNT